jgi:N,N-dimethylformamidase
VLVTVSPHDIPPQDQTDDPAPAPAAQSEEPTTGKQVTGYCEPWSLRAGEPIVLRAASHTPGPASLSLVRIHCGDPTRTGPGFSESVVDLAPAAGLGSTVELADQPLRPGSYGAVDLAGLTAASTISLSFSVMATRPSEPQLIASIIGESLIAQIVVEDGLIRARAGGADLVLRATPLATGRWYELELAIDIAANSTGAAVMEGSVVTAPSMSPGRDLLEPNGEPVSTRVTITPSKLVSLVFGGDNSGRNAGGRFDGRIANPRLTVDDTELWWDLSQEIDGPNMVDGSGNHRHGLLHQLPTRAVTGPDWNANYQRWTDEPRRWNAVHFHKDDLYDAGWASTAEVTLPKDLPSGIYAFRIETEHGDDRIPFFVRPAVGAATADVALLMSSATYLAYANHRMLFEGADFIGSRTRLRPEHEYVRTHPELGRSMYEKHPDGSGVMFSSRLRPVLNLRPGADGWNFTPDTDINAFLEQHLARPDADGRTRHHDVIADEDVHHDGLDALAPYRVIVTCSHPEYWSTNMLDALSQWQRNGGRLLYLGGNGFYWRVAFSEKWPGAMELRRAEDGVRNWQTGNGESYHAFGGEYGGMWRRLGRAPNELVGIGFAAQGFAKASHFEVNPAALDGRASWIWDGVEIEDGKIGTSGLGGGAAGQELDRYDTRLGSPPHAVVLASATEFGPDMIRTKEEFEGSVAAPDPDPYVRADMVFYETPNGGAVFSVGSISWFGALARNNFDNDVAKITGNVIDRFLDETPFEL